jgi:diguanylate cyclase (GGDEF)-like protein
LLRTADIFGRFGGEEFVIVCPETGLPGAVVIAERLRSQVENMSVPDLVGLPTITISLGIAEIEPDDSDINRTINRADKALYQAKAQGRNAVVAYHAS